MTHTHDTHTHDTHTHTHMTHTQHTERETNTQRHRQQHTQTHIRQRIRQHTPINQSNNNPTNPPINPINPINPTNQSTNQPTNLLAPLLLAVPPMLQEALEQVTVQHAQHLVVPGRTGEEGDSAQYVLVQTPQSVCGSIGVGVRTCVHTCICLRTI